MQNEQIEHYLKNIPNTIRRFLYFSDEIRFEKANKKFVHLDIYFVSERPSINVTISNSDRTNKDFTFTNEEFKEILKIIPIRD
jgi:hypothetical protein